MGVVARMRVNEVALQGWATRVKLVAVVPADDNDPHAEEIKSFFEATPYGSFEATIKNAVAAEQFQPGDDYYITLERISKPEPAA